MDAGGWAHQLNQQQQLQAILTPPPGSPSPGPAPPASLSSRLAGLYGPSSSSSLVGGGASRLLGNLSAYRDDWRAESSYGRVADLAASTAWSSKLADAAAAVLRAGGGGGGSAAAQQAAAAAAAFGAPHAFPGLLSASEYTTAGGPEGLNALAGSHILGLALRQASADATAARVEAEEAKAACEGGGRGGGGDVTFRAPCLACRAQEAPRP